MIKMKVAYSMSLRAGGAVLSALVVACGLVNSSGDSESHFLATCEASCERGFECICGVCTQPCDDNAQCQPLSDGASCRPLSQSECGTDTIPASSCDLACSSDAQCRSLGASHRCLDGQCRRDSNPIPMGSAGAAGTSGAAGGSSGAPPSGGASGSPSAGASGGAGGPDHDCCLNDPLSWALDGGFNPTPQRHTLSGCEFETTMGDASCTSQLPACNDGWELDANALEGVLAHADVRAAIAEAPVLYGIDARPVDGSVLIVELEGAQISIGYECSDAPCTPIPDGIRVLKRTLDTLAIQQSARGSCAPSPACYLPMVSPLCTSAFTRFAYDLASGTCVELDYGGCGTADENSFESGAECRSACQNDPCRAGTPFDSSNAEDCGVLANERCFEDGTRACLCACAATGATLDKCEIIEPIPARARCGS